MNFDKFIDILKQTEEFKDWYVEQSRFKGDNLISVKVIFEFNIEEDLESEH